MNPCFRERLNRAELLALRQPPPEKTIRVAVHRNHAFELIAPIVNVFLGLSEIRAEFWHSDYDDSLSFSNDFPADADIQIVWLDMGRYANNGTDGWLVDRLLALKSGCSGRILAACFGLDMARLPALPGVLYCDVSALLAPLGDKALDIRLQDYSGTRLSHASCLEIAREIGCRFIPALLYPPLKAVVLDCDHTLYAGVLGEEGIHGVAPHVELQTFLRGLKAQGFMLALASRNELEDVRRLFSEREDFPLRWEDFAAFGVNWNAKAENIKSLAASMNIGMESVLFIDDNPGELLSVRNELPDVRRLHASSPEATLSALRYYPGLFKIHTTLEDSLRSEDVRANRERGRMKAKLSHEDYLRELDIRLDFTVNAPSRAARAAELCNKTNQFILSYQRPTPDDIRRFLDDADKCVVAAAMSDRLSDSGVIAILLGSRAETALRVEELVVSCRALGRGMEDDMILKMLQLAGETLGTQNYLIRYKTGPRNQPALAWLKTRAAALQTEGEAVLSGKDIVPGLLGMRVTIDGRPL